MTVKGRGEWRHVVDTWPISTGGVQAGDWGEWAGLLKEEPPLRRLQLPFIPSPFYTHFGWAQIAPLGGVLVIDGIDFERVVKLWALGKF